MIKNAGPIKSGPLMASLWLQGYILKGYAICIRFRTETS